MTGFLQRLNLFRLLSEQERRHNGLWPILQNHAAQLDDLHYQISKLRREMAYYLTQDKDG